MDKWKPQFRDTSIPLHSPEAASIVAGWLAFGSTLAISTWVQGKFIGISTGSVRPIPTVFGMMTVGLASIMSHRASIILHDVAASKVSTKRTRTTRINSSTSGKFQQPSKSSDVMSIGEFQMSKQTIRICALGLVSFRLLGGRFWAISPSSYTHVGSFARRSIPATEKYATATQRVALARLGRICGCHTCGTRISFGRTVIADHQPPKSVVRQWSNSPWRKMLGLKPQFRFYPQCLTCSQIQGSLLSAATRQSSRWWWNPTSLANSGGGSAAYCHGWKFRWNHLTGAVVGAVTVVGASEKDIAMGNHLRFQKLEQTVSNLRNRPIRDVLRQM